jgi:hypothetical protein
MQIHRIVSFSLLLFLNTGCVSDNLVSQEEIQNQSKAADIVSAVLFDNDLDTLASYNIRKSGLVVIKFDESVSDQKYRKVVELLRSNTDIKGVRAEQAGVVVCGVR